jgi:hypothetical protein
MSQPNRADTTTPKPGRSEVIVQIKIKLLGVSKPPVWRRLQLPADTRLDHLHDIIIAAFGWQDYHMHVFTSGPEEFGSPDPELGHTDERRVSLGQLIGGVGDRLRYTYDFGDDWEHEKISSTPTPTSTTRCSSPRKAPAHQRTAAVPGDTPTSKRSSPTPATNNTKRCSTGSAWTTPPRSTPTP